MGTLYAVSEWDRHFENNRTRDLKRMEWVPMPTKQDGDGYTELLDHKNGAAHFGAWCAIVELAAKSKPRGALVRDGGIPHDVASLSRVTRISRVVFEEAIPRLLQIRWLTAQVVGETDTCDDPAVAPQEGAAIPQEGAASRARAQAPATGQDRTGHGTEGNGKTHKAPQQAAVAEVVAHYQQKFPRRVVGAIGRKLITDRLREGFTAEQLCEAIDGCLVDPFHQGENPRGKKYDQVRHVFKDESKVNDFIDTARDGPAPVQSEGTMRTERARQEVVKQVGRFFGEGNDDGDEHEHEAEGDGSG